MVRKEYSRLAWFTSIVLMTVVVCRFDPIQRSTPDFFYVYEDKINERAGHGIFSPRLEHANGFDHRCCRRVDRVQSSTKNNLIFLAMPLNNFRVYSYRIK
jgi:hypothetical protein